MPTITQIATTIDELVQHELEHPFEMDARLYATDPDGAWLIGESDNPYDLLVGDSSVARPRSLTAIGFVCTGWAAPLANSESVAPSQHPERIRVRITVAYNGSEWTTVMRKEGDSQPEVMDDQGTGALADAIESWWQDAEVIF